MCQFPGLLMELNSQKNTSVGHEGIHAFLKFGNIYCSAAAFKSIPLFKSRLGNLAKSVPLATYTGSGLLPEIWVQATGKST